MPNEMHEAGADRVAYGKGYEDGFEERTPVDIKECQMCYSQGYIAGTNDRRAVDRSGSSNT